MAHASGWIELYGILEEGGEPSRALVEQCLRNRNGLGETMLHWYAIEGAPDVLQKLVDLGFDVDAADDTGHRPIVSAARILRWDNVRVLRRAGARTRGVTPTGTSYRGLVAAAGDAVPEDLRGDAYDLEDLLDPNGPEDAAVMSLRVTPARSGAGTPLTQATWNDWLAAHPEFDAHAFRFEAKGDDGAPYVEVLFPDLPVRRRMHRIAVHFGARVVWAFVAGE